MSNGLNRFIIHTSVHQPVDDKIPGLGLGPFGQWFTRHETWAEMALPWTTYLSRSSYMLQQGRFVADILYYYGEDSNITALFGEKMPDIPAGYSFDFVSADVVLNRLSVKDGRIVTAVRHELPAPGARSQQPAHVARRPAQDPRSGQGRSGRRRPQAHRQPQPGRRPGGIPAPSRTSSGTAAPAKAGSSAA